MNEIIQTFLLSMAPVGELRLALPMAITVFKLDWALAFFVSVIGNIVPVVLLLFFLEPVSSRLSKESAYCNRFFAWLFERTRKKSFSGLEKYGSLALVTFVAVPLPFTGAWTGAIAAFLFGISFKKAFPLIASGVIIAGIIVLILTTLGIWLI